MKPKKNPIEYNFDCLEDEKDGGQGKIISLGNDLEAMLLEDFGEEVTIDEEEAMGEKVFQEYESIVLSNESSSKLEAILTGLVEQISNPKGYHYKIYLLDKDELNAWTCGGRIFVTKKMFDFCQSDAELACVIGHEIYHNELGHIRRNLQKTKMLTNIGAVISELLTTPFGQKDETHCDLKGIDLAYAAGFNGCVNIKLWNRMKSESKEGDYNPFWNILRSHPYSEKRADCSRSHIENNYEISCE